MADDAVSRARAEPPKRLTRQWRVRTRFALVRRVGATLGLLLAAGMIAASAAALPDPWAALGGGFLLQAAVLLAAGGGLPWVVIGALADWADCRYWQEPRARPPAEVREAIVEGRVVGRRSTGRGGAGLTSGGTVTAVPPKVQGKT